MVTAAGVLVFLAMAVVGWNLRRAGEVPMVWGMVGYLVGGVSGFAGGIDWTRQSGEDKP
jgi:uncharacterized membrane protein AbrB (regulator of aidB expression)